MGLPRSAGGPRAHPQSISRMVGASNTEPQQIAPLGETGQPRQAPEQKPLTTYALHFIHHLQGAPATMQSLFLLQEYLGFAFCLF